MTRSCFAYLLLMVVGAGVVTSCAAPDPEADGAPPAISCADPGARDVVERLGDRIKRVPLLAPDSILAREIREAYATLVTPDLLDAWVADPVHAPGRSVSSPWPERIEIRSVEEARDESCRIEGDLVYVTSVEVTQGGPAIREAVSLRVVQDRGGWRVSAYEAAASTPVTEPTTTPQNAPDVLRNYYAAINARDYRRAYEMWGDRGTASNQSLEEFAAGYAETMRVEVEIGEPGRVEPAAGSRYVRIPVVVRAVTVSEDSQRFEGTYTLRRSVADGASVEQRRWHIYSAEIDRTL